MTGAVRWSCAIAFLLLFPMVAAAQTPGSEVPGRYIVLFRTDVEAPEIVAADLGRTHGFRVAHVYQFATHGMVIEIAQGSERGILRALRQDPRVRALGPDRYVAAFAQQLPNNVDRVNAEPGVGANPGAGVQVAIIDTGLDMNHADLAGNINSTLSVTCVGGGGSCIPGGMDDNGHGTAVGGIVAAINNTSDIVGAAPEVELIAVKVLDANGSGTLGDASAGLDYLTGLNLGGNLIEVANMSLGAACSVCTDDSTDPAVSAFHEATRALVNSGTTIAVAAGNGSADASTTVPASFDEVITVSALGDSDGKPGGQGGSLCLFWFFDCFAPLADDSFALTSMGGFSNFGPDVDVIAPGVLIPLLKLGGGVTNCNFVNTSSCSGTSFSSPHAAAVAAIFIRHRLDTTGAVPLPGTVRQALIETGECYEAGAGAGGLFHGTGGCPQVWPNDPDGLAEPMVRADNVINFAPTGTRDVAVTSITPPTLAVTGTSHEVSVGVANLGDQSETFTVTLTDSLEPAFNASQQTTLAAGGSSTLLFTWTPAVAGTRTLTAATSGVVGDADTSNDSKQAAVTVVDPSHDVAVSSISAPATVVQGHVADISVGVANEGTFDEDVTVSLSADPSGGTMSGPQGFPLAAGASSTRAFTWDTTGAAAGPYTLTASVAPVPDEADTADNQQSAPTTVEEPRHDVAVTGIISQDVVNKPDNLGISVGVANQGNLTETFNVTLTDTPPEGGTAGTWATANPQSVMLDPGATTSLIFIYESANASEGNHTLTATADTVPGETDTDDNALSKVVNVSEETIDIAITSVTAPVSVPENQLANVDVGVANQGDVEMSVTVSLNDFPPEGGTAGTVSAPQPVTLAAGASTTLTFAWNTTGAATGAHLLSAIFSPVGSDGDPTDNTNSTSSTVTLAGPTSLTAVGDAIITGRGRNKVVEAVWVDLAWQDNSASEESYVIERCEVIVSGKGKNKTTTCTFAALTTVAANTTAYRDESVSSGATYRFRLKAQNSLGSSPYSNEAEATTP